MNAKQLERASYLAAHAILATNTSAPHLATPGARRTYTVDVIAQKIRNVFELHCSALDEATEWVVDIPTRGQTRQSKVRPETESADTPGQKLQLVMQDLH